MKHINELLKIADEVNKLDDAHLEYKLKILKGIIEEGTATYDEIAELSFICMKIIVNQKLKGYGS